MNLPIPNEDLGIPNQYVWSQPKILEQKMNDDFESNVPIPNEDLGRIEQKIRMRIF